ncbi:MAG: response regulator [Salinivenus sp.]
MPELTEPILLALSHKPSANLLDDRLSRKEATVVRVRDGEEALRRIQKRSFGVVVAETGLPGRTGPELLRSVPPLQPPFVLMGRQGNGEGVIRAFNMNAFDYFTRPFAPEVATARILRVPRLLSTATEARVPIPK